MDTSRTNGSLLEEINFLTNLIQSHREQQSGPSHQVKGRAVGPTSHSKSRYTPYQVPTTHHPHPHHPHPPSRVKARGRRSKANNLVYRPKNVSKTLLTSSPVSDPPSSSPGCLKATKTLGGPSLVVKREIIPKSVGRPAVLKSGDQTSISRTVVCVKTEPGLRIKTEPGSELSASKTPPHGSSSSNGGRSILVASDPRGKERVIITATRGASTSAQQTTTPEATALVAAVGGAGVGKGGSDEAEEAAMKLYKRQKRLRRKANAKARRELKHSTPSGHPPPPHFPLPPPPHFPLPPPPHTHTPPPPHSHIPPPPHSHISPPPHQPSAPPPHHPPLPRQPPAPPPHPPSYPHQPPAPPPHLPHRAPPPHSHPPPPPYPFHAPPPSFHLHFSKLRSKFKPSPQERRRKWVRKLAVTPTGATPKSGLLTSGVATNGMAGTVTKKRKSRPRKVRSRKGKDGLFKNKVWVPPDSSQNQPPQPHQPKPPRTPPTKTTKPSKNKVWIPPQNETEVIFISPKPGSRAKPALQEKPLALLGREITTKQGNKQWVLDGAKKPSSSLGLATPGVRKDMERSAKPVRLFGHEKKTKQGNKQWVVAGLVPKRTTRRRSRIKSSLVSFSGGRYSLDATGKRLKRLSTSSSSQLAALSPAISSYIGGVARNSSRRLMASRVVKKSKAYVWHARMKKKQDRSKQFCLFYNRFGKCNKGAECPYIHDPDKIAVCTRFLKGACDKMDGTCPFSHKISKEKMPVCSFFLRGVCSKEDCPYLHVSVGRDAEVCPDFLKGYCTRGEKCTMQHTLDCPKFSRTGSCPEGSKCPLRHNNKRNNKELQVPAAGLVKEPRAFKKVRCRQEVVSGGRVPEGKGQGDTGEGSEEGSSEPKQPARGVSPITINELEFMPLEINTGMRCSIGSSGHCLCASCDVCSAAVSGLEFSILIKPWDSSPTLS